MSVWRKHQQTRLLLNIRGAVAVVGGRGVGGESAPFFFFFLRRRKTKVSDREFDPRWRHSACETVIALHMVK